ncbi:MAG: sensor histidine kinase [Polyangiaceae bacterium]|nr:sensor histidine kinase [Polyangiaceae bacterium]
MSRKKFLEALQRVRLGDHEGARRSLDDVDLGFIHRRLQHYLGQPDHREAAVALEDALRARLSPREVPADLVPPAFEGPLAPAGPVVRQLGYIDFDHPEAFLRWASADWDSLPPLDLGALTYTDVWALVGLASLRLPERGRRPPVAALDQRGVGRFAHALGLEGVMGGAAPTLLEAQRTVRLTRVSSREAIEPVAERIASLLLTGARTQDAQLTARYVLIELLRNAIQHSGDPLGAVVAAQRMDERQHRARPMIQVAVADAGVGIPRSLKRQHPHLVDYRQALERALLPHISGTFREGLTGSFENAGLGLYVISEMARKTGGRMLLATPGAALVLRAGAEGPRFLQPPGVGFPGTLAAFELPIDAERTYTELISSILRTAELRTPKRQTHRWLVYRPEQAATVVHLREAREDTLAAARVAETSLRPAILERRAVVLDFDGLDLCTQSWLHALLYEAVRLAWALQTPVHVVNAEPAVVEGLRFLEAYALGG